MVSAVGDGASGTHSVCPWSEKSTQAVTKHIGQAMVLHGPVREVGWDRLGDRDPVEEDGVQPPVDHRSGEV